MVRIPVGCWYAPFFNSYLASDATMQLAIIPIVSEPLSTKYVAPKYLAKCQVFVCIILLLYPLAYTVYSLVYRAK